MLELLPSPSPPPSWFLVVATSDFIGKRCRLQSMDCSELDDNSDVCDDVLGG